jgi:type IV secretory pathway TrbD component
MENNSLFIKDAILKDFRRFLLGCQADGFLSREGRGNRFLEVACWLIAGASFGAGLWFFGKYNLPALLLSDMLFAVVIILSVIGIILLPSKAAAIVAGLAGAIVGCLCTGWCFGVCYIFNGHNNEVGGLLASQSSNSSFGSVLPVKV